MAIVKDGALRGRFIAQCTTIITWILYILAFIGWEPAIRGWERIGTEYLYGYLGTMTAWMGTNAIVKVPEVLGKIKEKIEEIKAKNGGQNVEAG